jgi:hypothetical protein
MCACDRAIPDVVGLRRRLEAVPEGAARSSSLQANV